MGRRRGVTGRDGESRGIGTSLASGIWGCLTPDIAPGPEELQQQITFRIPPCLPRPDGRCISIGAGCPSAARLRELLSGRCINSQRCLGCLGGVSLCPEHTPTRPGSLRIQATGTTAGTAMGNPGCQHLARTSSLSVRRRRASVIRECPVRSWHLKARSLRD